MEGDVSMYLVHPAMRAWLDAWLLSQGFEVRRTPFLDDDSEDALPTFLIAPTEERMRALGPASLNPSA